MIDSRAIQFMEVEIPSFEGHIHMKHFNASTLDNVPDIFKGVVNQMLSVLPKRDMNCWLTVDGKTIEAGKSHRRGGPHIDGNYLDAFYPMPNEAYERKRREFSHQHGEIVTGHKGGWDDGWRSKNAEISREEAFFLSYNTKSGGILITSNYRGCKGWVGMIHGAPTAGGDCSHLTLPEAQSFIMRPNVVYYGNSHFIHESIPQETNVHRVVVRITLPLDYPWL